MKAKDKEIIDAILTYISSDMKMEDEIAKYVAKPDFDMSAEEFDDWLSTVEVK